MFETIAVRLEKALNEAFKNAQNEIKVNATQSEKGVNVELTILAGFQNYEYTLETEFVGKEKLTDLVYDSYQNFDVDKFVYMWLDAKENGDSSVPDVSELVDTAKEIEKTLDEMVVILANANLATIETEARLLSNHGLALSDTDRDYDFVSILENENDRAVTITFDSGEQVTIQPKDWIGFTNDEQCKIDEILTGIAEIEHNPTLEDLIKEADANKDNADAEEKETDRSFKEIR